MNNWNLARNSPQDEAAYWRSIRPYGTFIVALSLILISSLGGFALGVVIVTALSVVSGVATFRGLIRTKTSLRRLAHLGEMRRGFVVLWALVFVAIVIVQAILAVEVGAWLAGAISPLAVVVEWLIARELCGTRPSGGSGRQGS